MNHVIEIIIMMQFVIILTEIDTGVKEECLQILDILHKK